MITYTFLCRHCDFRYQKYPITIVIGPLLEERAGVAISDTDLTLYQSERVFIGDIRDLKCGECHLQLLLPDSIAMEMWNLWLTQNSADIGMNPLLRRYVRLAEVGPDQSIEFPESKSLPCFRCGGVLHSGPKIRECPKCGSRDVNLVPARP